MVPAFGNLRLHAALWGRTQYSTLALQELPQGSDHARIVFDVARMVAALKNDELAVLHAAASDAERLKLAADDLIGVGRIDELRIEAADVESVTIAEIRLETTGTA